MASTRPALLRILGLSATLGANPVLHNLDLPELPANRLVALLGPNGCGKSTLLKSIAGLIPSTCDTLSMGAVDLRALDAQGRSDVLRYLPQATLSDVHLTVREAAMVAYQARRAKPRSGIRDGIDDILDELNIAHLRHEYIDELSGGQKQLVGLAQALIHKPGLVLLDEPLASLDMNYQIHVMQVLTRLTRERGLTAIVVLHDLDVALRYADQAWLLHQGRLVASGTPSNVVTPPNLARAFSIRARLERDSLGLPHVFVDDLLQI